MSLFKSYCEGPHVVVLDGAMGTMFQKHGLPSGVSPEVFGQERPDIVETLHTLYAEVGAKSLTTNTFGGCRLKLPAGTDVTALNRSQVEAARRVADRFSGVMVAGSVGPTGKFVKPLGDLDFLDLVEIFREQIRGIAQGGADYIVAETHFDIAEVRAAAVAARDVCDLPICLSMTLEEGVTLTGANALTFVDVAQNLGVDMVMLNCGAGPEQFIDWVKTARARLELPLALRPNAGLPILEDGETVFKMGPEEFAKNALALPPVGAKFIGGCCGTTPEHIAALAGAVQGVEPAAPTPEPARFVVTSRAQSTPVGPGKPFVVIGERINPTGKQQLIDELQAGELTEALRLAKEQLERGAPILDVNVGAPMVNEAELLPKLVLKLVERCQTPLCLDSSYVEALEAGLAAYPGSALVNSISGEPGRMETLGPLCKRFGAPFILLPIKGKKLPVKAEERIAIIEELLAQADALGVPRRLVMVDPLALAVSSKPEAAAECLKTIRYVTETLGLPTTLGLSNTSFGLPARELVNAAFLSMAMGAGLSSAIANPDSARMQEAIAASETLVGRDPGAERFIRHYSDWKPTGGGASSAPGGGGKQLPPDLPQGDLEQAVIKGEQETAVALTERAIQQGEKAFDVVNGKLIPAITAVGELYEKKIYFLPQLLQAAEAMQQAFAVVKPLLEEDAEGAKAKPVVIMATVEGDIHDIGKNIVNLMLGNYGFDVVDLGKDVSARQIVDEAKRRNAAVIGLSALMTTTMVRMEDTVKLLQDEGLGIPVMVGGAVVTRDYADAIGAAGYADDAVGAVREAQRLVVSEKMQ